MNLIEELCRASGVSGFERNVASVIKKQLQKSCETVEEDSFGNVIARKGKGEKKIMLAAHMDEIGLMVKHINEKGFISFIKIGGIDDRVLLNQRVIIKSKKGDVQGIIGSKPPHLQKADERKKVIKHDEMFIDIGAKDRKDAEGKIAIGDPIIFEANYGSLNKKIFYGKAVDNRIGCYVMLKVMERLPRDIKSTIYAVATAQEEVGLKGARVSAFKLEPDYAFAIDTTIAGDTPQIKENESDLKVGEGPAITITEASGRGVVTHPKLRDLLIKTAKKHKIPYQVDVLEGGMTDAAIIYMTRAGVPSGVISIPCRYIHSSSGVFSVDDVDNSIKLLVNALKELK
ncbi:MAG: M42 family metallopeptidase [Candidatus Altiarchaeota archaeon]|nr:M42 family metallopeptidase [Candidatus Altiarchaeota archaeon]